MAYKILINKQAVPVLIEVPEKPDKGMLMSHVGNSVKGRYEQALSTAIADESKHIAFKDEADGRKVLDKCFQSDGLPVSLRIGQTFDLPENVSVSFEEVCKCELESLKGNAEMCFACIRPKEFKLAILTTLATGGTVSPDKVSNVTIHSNDFFDEKKPIRFEQLMQISEQILKANNSGVREIKVVGSDVVTTDGIGILFLSTRDFEEFKKRQDPTKDHEG